MKLYKTISVDLDVDKEYAEFTPSADAASKARTRLKRQGHTEINTEEVDVPTTRTELVAFLNGMLAHESWKPEAVAEKLKDS